MGQAASRQGAKQVQRAAGKQGAQAGAAPPPPRPPPLGRPVADAPEVTEDATQALLERQHKEAQELLKPESRSQPSAAPAIGRPQPPPRPPVADPNSGFFRGQISDPRDVAQEQFLQHQSGGSASASENVEMAPDLLKFLQEVGPLEKRVNKKLTSPRLVKELEQQGEKAAKTEKMHRFEAAQRTRDDMRLVKDIEGFSTPRTTNFFYSSAVEEEDLKDFGLNDLEIFDLLRRNAAAATGEEETDNICEVFYKEKIEPVKESAGWTAEEMQEQKELLKSALAFINLPVVVKDDEANYIGMQQNELDKQFAHQKLDVVDESRVKLVLADLTDLQKKEIKRIR